MRASFLTAAAIVSAVSLSGCCLFRPQAEAAEPIGQMGAVLQGVQKSLVLLKNSTDEKVGLGVSKITGTFKVTGLDKASGELTLGIAKPVGSATFGGSTESSRENTIVVEFTPAGPTYEKCGKDGKDSDKRDCVPGQIVEIPGKGPVVLSVNPKL